MQLVKKHKLIKALLVLFVLSGGYYFFYRPYANLHTEYQAEINKQSDLILESSYTITKKVCKQSVYIATSIPAIGKLKSPEEYVEYYRKLDAEADIIINNMANKDDFMHNQAFNLAVAKAKKMQNWDNVVNNIAAGDYPLYGTLVGQAVSLYDIMYVSFAPDYVLKTTLDLGSSPTGYLYKVLLETNYSQQNPFQSLGEHALGLSEYNVEYQGRTLNLASYAIVRKNNLGFQYLTSINILPQVDELSVNEIKLFNNKFPHLLEQQPALLTKVVISSNDNDEIVNDITLTQPNDKSELSIGKKLIQRYRQFQLEPLSVCLASDHYQVVNTIHFDKLMKLIQHLDTPQGKQIFVKLSAMEPLHQDYLLKQKDQTEWVQYEGDLFKKESIQLLVKKALDGALPLNLKVKSSSILEYLFFMHFREPLLVNMDMLKSMLEKGYPFRLYRIMYSLSENQDKTYNLLQDINFDLKQRQNGENLATLAAKFGDVKLTSFLLNLGLSLEVSEGSDVLDRILRGIDFGESLKGYHEIIDLLVKSNFKAKDSHTYQLQRLQQYKPKLYTALIKLYPFLESIAKREVPSVNLEAIEAEIALL